MFNIDTDRKTIPPHEQSEHAAFSNILRDVNHKLISGVDYEAILDSLFIALSPLIPFDRIGVATIEKIENCEYLRSRWVKSKTRIEHLKVDYAAPVKGSSLEHILTTGTPRIINDLRAYLNEHPESQPTSLALKDNILSSLTFPLISNGKPLGAVFFSSEKANTYNEKHIKIFSDIAEEFSLVVAYHKISERQIESASQNLRMILHDLKSPLGVIQGFLDVALGENWYESIAPEAKYIFSILNRNAQYSIDLLTEISELTQFDSRLLSLNKKLVDMDTFCSEMALSFTHMAAKKNIKFTLHKDVNVPKACKFDPVQIHRVIDNFVTNAIKYSKRDTEINLYVRSKAGYLQFEVHDQGLGIPKNEIHNLFKEFGKTSTRPTENESSTGLGLAIAKKFVEQHGGEIWADSTINVGSVFAFKIPIEV